MNQLLTLLQSNQFFSGGFVLLVIGALGAWLRRVPGRAWHWVKGLFVIEIDILDRDTAFDWVTEWLAQHPYSQRRARYLSVKTERVSKRSGRALETRSMNGPRRIILSPAPGSHWIFWRRHFLVVTRDRKEDAKGDYGITVHESLKIRFFTRNRQLVMDLLNEAKELIEPTGDRRISVQTVNYSDWNEAIKRRPRELASVILAKGVMEELVKDIETFLGQAEWYAERGIPYKRGYLLYGAPGNGKSSAILALATHFNLDIYSLALGSTSCNDDGLRQLLTSVPEQSIVLIEDIDCVFEQREKASDKENRVTFSGLLNVLDGVATSEGRILVMTTNHIEKLDSALIRPGRCDVRLEIQNPDADQMQRMFERFFPNCSFNPSVFAPYVGKVSMAQIQGHLLRYGNPQEALANLNLLETV